MTEQKQTIPDVETFERLQKELLELMEEKAALEDHYKHLLVKATSIEEVRRPIIEKYSLQLINQMVILFMSQKVMERKNQVILQKKKEYQEDCKKMKNRIAELLQTIE